MSSLHSVERSIFFFLSEVGNLRGSFGRLTFDFRSIEKQQELDAVFRYVMQRGSSVRYGKGHEKSEEDAHLLHGCLT